MAVWMVRAAMKLYVIPRNKPFLISPMMDVATRGHYQNNFTCSPV